jgi:hypothetical protein
MCVYSCCGCGNTTSPAPCSTVRPACITATWSARRRRSASVVQPPNTGSGAANLTQQIERVQPMSSPRQSSQQRLSALPEGRQPVPGCRAHTREPCGCAAAAIQPNPKPTGSTPGAPHGSGCRGPTQPVRAVPPASAAQAHPPACPASGRSAQRMHRRARRAQGCWAVGQLGGLGHAESDAEQALIRLSRVLRLTADNFGQEEQAFTQAACCAHNSIPVSRATR